MSPEANITMGEALRLTRAGRLTEATAVLQRGLATLGTAAPRESTAAQPFADLGQPRLAMSSSRRVRWAELPRAYTAPTRPGPVERLQGALPGLPDIVSPPGSPGGARLSSGGAAARAAAAPGGEIRHLTHTERAGARSYDLYIPTRYAGEPVPLVVMLHGGKQNGLDFAAGTWMNEFAEQHNFLVAYPEQSRAANAGRYWNWFSAADQQADAGEPAIIAGITREVMRDLVVDPTRVYIAGLSAGGAMAAVMAATYQDLYAAVGVHSGIAYGAANDVASAFAAMRTGGTAAPTECRAADRHPRRPRHDRGSSQRRQPDRRSARGGRHHRPGCADHHTQRRRAPTPACVHRNRDGTAAAESLIVHGGSHAWYGGSPVGSYTNPQGPNSSAEMIRFFLQHQGLRTT